MNRSAITWGLFPLSLFCLVACEDRKNAETIIDPAVPVEQKEHLISNTWNLPRAKGEFAWFTSRLYPENVGEKKYTLSLRWCVKDFTDAPRIQTRFGVQIFAGDQLVRAYVINANKTGLPESPYSSHTLRTPNVTILDELTYERSFDFDWGKKYRIYLSAGGVLTGSSDFQTLRIFDIVLIR